MRHSKFTTLLVITLTTTACSNIQRTTERTQLLHSSGPEVSSADVRDYFEALDTLRSFYSEIGIIRSDGELKYIKLEKRKPIGMSATDLLAVREGIFAYIDHRCDAYIDAIFWANRGRGGFTSGNNAIAGASGAIIGATGGSATALAVLAAAFGLSGNLFDAYYDSVLFGLEPSGIQSLVDKARTVYLQQPALNVAIPSEGLLLAQVQNYIRLCTPAHIEFLVNESIQSANLETLDGAPDVLANFGNFTLRTDGAVVGADGTVFPPFGEPALPAAAGFTLEDGGRVNIGGKIVNLNGTWVKPTEVSESDNSNSGTSDASVTGAATVTPEEGSTVETIPLEDIGSIVSAAPAPVVSNNPVAATETEKTKGTALIRAARPSFVGVRAK